MKIKQIISLLAIILLGSTAALAQEKKSCKFDLQGTWKAQISNTEARLYRFDSDGVVTVLEATGAAEPHKIATAKYDVVEDLGTPKAVAFTATGKNRIFGALRKTMKIVSYDDSSITCAIPGMGTTRWTRVDPDRYFIVLAARTDEFVDTSGSAFPMVIKLAGGVSTIDAFGLYRSKEGRTFGTVPPDVYKEYMREARKDNETTLRLEINSRQYERALKIIKEWERRVREDALLYVNNNTVSEADDPLALNNILVAKAVTESLNQCSEDVDLHRLTYLHPEDWVTGQTGSKFVPFVYFKELRRRNEARHIGDQKFQELIHIPNLASR